MKTLQWMVRSTREKGLVQTAKIAVNFIADLSFDWKYGTDTMRWVPRESLETQSDNQSHSAPYRATKVRPFLRLLEKLRLPRDSAFVDIGAGKGRVLLIASQYGFRKVVGIEFCGQLCALARKNLELFARKSKVLSPIEIIEADATTYEFQPEHRVFFMYNPFDSFVLTRVLDNIHSSLETNPRRIWLIYNTPQHHDVIKRVGLFTSDSLYVIGGNYFRIYTT
jgi:SAM-dependent methyltransferase